MKKNWLLLIVLAALAASASAQCSSTGNPHWIFVICQCDESFAVGGGCQGLDGLCQVDILGTLCGKTQDGFQCYVGDAESCASRPLIPQKLASLDGGSIAHSQTIPRFLATCGATVLPSPSNLAFLRKQFGL